MTPVIPIKASELNNTFFLSDFHFDHVNIINYCNRPFKTVEEMNETMLTNFFSVVKKDSTFFFLGDMAFGRDSEKPKDWLWKLHGNIFYIKGSHDHGIRPTTPNLNARLVCSELIVETPEYTFWCGHDPNDAPTKYSYVIHGHKHNEVPHIHGCRYSLKINVSVECINYTPISLAKIIEEVKDYENLKSS